MKSHFNHGGTNAGGTQTEPCIVADARRSLVARSNEVDQSIRLAVEQHLTPKLAIPFAITAVGGYGRRELFPYSDIDILVLVEAESDMAAVKEPLGEFLRVLWDSGLRASQSVRTIAECCRLHEQNIELHISLLDLRLVCGDLGLFEQLTHALPDFYRKQEAYLIRELAGMARQRHAKFNGTVYHLEPNIKEAPGGIRDIHFLHWFALLAQDKGPVREALSEIENAKQFLHAVRSFFAPPNPGATTMCLALKHRTRSLPFGSMNRRTRLSGCACITATRVKYSNPLCARSNSPS